MDNNLKRKWIIWSNQRHKIAEWIRKHEPHICCLQETHLRTKDLHRLKVKGSKQIFQANRKKKAGVAILISEKIDFQRRAIKRDPEGHLYSKEESTKKM